MGYTAVLFANEEIEYQVFRRTAPMEYVNEIAKDVNARQRSQGDPISLHSLGL